MMFLMFIKAHFCHIVPPQQALIYYQALELFPFPHQERLIMTLALSHTFIESILVH